jgi:alkaline phosphatase
MKDQNRINRRDFIKITGAGVALAGMGGIATAQTEEKGAAKPATPPAGAPKNIIFMVADGMSLALPSIAEEFSHLTRQKGLNLTRLLQQPETAKGFFETHSLSSIVTDSSAASSAWGSGSRVFNGSVNVLPDGTKLKPLAMLAHEAGKRMGLVTTTTITHATPAGFAAQQGSRGDEADIAPQYNGRVDVLMGGGRQFFDPTMRKDKRDLIQEYRDAGYAFIDKRAHVTRMHKKPEKLLGLFWNGHIPFTIDHENNEDIARDVPTLAEMTAAALDILGSHPNGFLLQIEGGRVDHAAHGNDPAAALWDLLAFDDAIGVAEEFVKNNPDTLVVITSDHGTGNPGLNGKGSNYSESNESFARLAKFRGSNDVVYQRFSDAKKQGPLTAEIVQGIIKDVTALDITQKEAQAIAEAASGQLPNEFNYALRSVSGIMGQILGNHTAVEWTGTNHTADYTMIASIGKGREKFGGLLKNTDAFPIIVNFMGLDFKNPSFTREKAEKYLSYAPDLSDEAYA